MNRRDFIRTMGLGLTTCWAFGRLPWPLNSQAAGTQLCLALLADAHLKSADSRRPEAQALARAVAEINALTPLPDVVLFGGDLAHKGRPEALDLGREILSGLSSPLLTVRGEGDCGRGGDASWVRRFGPSTFFESHQGILFVGLDTTWCNTPHGPAFELGLAQHQWLARQLSGLDPATPLVILSHAPLAWIFHPWQQWTADAPDITSLLAPFRQVVCVHGHVHGMECRGRGWGTGNARVSGQLPVSIIDNDWCENLAEKNRKQENEKRLVHLSLPATAWSLPSPLQGTPAVLRPGIRSRGCGWVQGTLSPENLDFQPFLWQV